MPQDCTDSQKAAARAKSQKSRGPKSPHGKLASSAMRSNTASSPVRSSFRISPPRTLTNSPIPSSSNFAFKPRRTDARPTHARRSVAAPPGLGIRTSRHAPANHRLARYRVGPHQRRRLERPRRSQRRRRKGIQISECATSGSSPKPSCSYANSAQRQKTGKTGKRTRESLDSSGGHSLGNPANHPPKPRKTRPKPTKSRRKPEKTRRTPSSLYRRPSVFIFAHLGLKGTPTLIGISSAHFSNGSNEHSSPSFCRRTL